MHELKEHCVYVYMCLYEHMCLYTIIHIPLSSAFQIIIIFEYTAVQLKAWTIN